MPLSCRYTTVSSCTDVVPEAGVVRSLWEFILKKVQGETPWLQNLVQDVVGFLQEQTFIKVVKRLAP